jgi:all-trans-8'-apo-beta-carotenal 15,15'-oxygenase
MKTEAVTASKAHKPAWSKAIAHPAQEFSLTPLPIISGAIPSDLQGTLYRNGPARLQRGGIQVGHWFDGDGAILAVHFAEGQARATYRYVQTAGYVAETEANQLMFGGYGMVAPGAWHRRFGRASKNVANTSVLALDDRLLALWEGGLPHALDLETLETRGIDNLEGLEQRLPYSAHPKRDPQTGEIYNFGITYGKNAILHLYRSDRQGKLLRKNQLKLPGLSMVHDFVMAGNYLIFCVPPLRLNPLPVLLNLKSYSESLQWQPQVGTEIIVIDRHSLALVSRNTVEPWYQWHFGNGYSDRDGNVAFDLVRYGDFRTNQYLKEIVSGQTQTDAQGYLWQMRLNPLTGKLLESTKLLDQTVEFPSVSPLQVGQPSRYTYVSMRRSDAVVRQELFGAIARYDHQLQTAAVADLGVNHYGMEPLFIPHVNHSENGWIITVVFDGDRECSEVWIFESDRLDQGAIARMSLPGVVPMGFHGTWR